MMILQGSMDSTAVDGALADFQASLSDPSAALAAVAEELRASIAEQFSTEGAAGGTPWAPLAPSTLRKDRGARAGILYVTGALYESLVDPGAPGHVEQLDGQGLLMGSDLPYAIFQQTGTGLGFGQTSVAGAWQLPRGSGEGRRGARPGRGGALPMRPLMAVTDADSESWKGTILAQIEAGSPLLGDQEMNA